MNKTICSEILKCRYYRSPEIVLEYPRKSCAIDIWSMGCTLAELYKGGILFKGYSNNELIWNQMSVLGSMPRQLIRASRRGHAMFSLGHQLPASTQTASTQNEHGRALPSAGANSISPVVIPPKVQPDNYYFCRRIRIKEHRKSKND